MNKRIIHRHGMHGTKLYCVWQGMKARCNNPNHIDFRYYGGRGITMCAEWYDPGSFIAWALQNGYEEGLSLDRIDNNKGYSPDNCRWTTHKQQMRNYRGNRLISYNGETHCLSEWAEITGINIGALKGRLRAGWQPEQMLTTPVSRSNSGLRYGRMN